jgi:hypothetical protein
MGLDLLCRTYPQGLYRPLGTHRDLYVCCSSPIKLAVHQSVVRSRLDIFKSVLSSLLLLLLLLLFHNVP